MFYNIGGKIKGLSKFLGWFFLIAGALGFLGSLLSLAFTAGVGALILGLVGYMTTWPLYGFGQLIESAEEIASTVQEINNRQRRIADQAKIPK